MTEVLPNANGPNDDEKGKVERAGFKAMLDNIVASERSKWRDEMAAEIEKYVGPDTSKVPDFAPERTREEAPPRIRLSDPRDHLYARFDEREREWRTPAGDHWMAEWIRGDTFKDDARKFRAAAELEGVFGRATTEEGVAGASGAVSTGTGGSLIPRPLENVVFIARDKVAKMRRFASLFTMTAQTHTVPTAAAMTAAMADESTTAAQGEPTISNVQLTARKAQVTAVATKEILADAAINLVNLYATRAGTALGSLEDDQFFKEGDGSAPNISAFISGTAHSETTSGILAFGDVMNMYYDVGQVYRASGVWFVAANVLQMVAKVVDGNGRPLYLGLLEKPAAITDDPSAEGTILRRPVYEVPLTNGTIWFGDPRAEYIIGQRQGLEVSASEHIKFDLDQVMWKFTMRFDGNNVDTVAAQVATGITSATSATVGT